MIRFAAWPLLLIGPLVILAVALVRPRRSLGQTYTGPFDVASRGRQRLLRVPSLLVHLGLILMSMALARPQSGDERLPGPGEGLDIIITLDVSGSMQETDYYPTRLEAAKAAALEFIEGRPNDRIGLVIYAGEPLTVCPPTFDHNTLEMLLSKASLGNLPDLTAIGSGLAVAARGLGYSRAASRVIILLSDGTDTSGMIDPVTVARAIATLHGDSLRVYTVAVGKGTSVPSRSGYPVDRETLAAIAGITGGRLFDVNSAEELQEVYDAIDELEASTLPEEGLFVFRDLYGWFALLSVLLLVVGKMLHWSVLRVVGD